jgi:Domain of unknown function (DUF4386)
MTEELPMQPKILARIAGLLYLIVIIGAAFAVSVRNSAIEPGDAAATADNIRASATLFRVGFVVDLVAGLIFVLTAMALYVLLKHVNQPVAAAMVIFVALGSAVATVNLLNHYTALTIATNETYTEALGEAGADALVLLYADMFTNGNTLNHIWFGPWLVPLAYLVIRSGCFPKALGVLQVIGCFGYLGWLFTTFLAPGAPAGLISAFLAVAVLGEAPFVLWLAVMGIRVPTAAGVIPAFSQPQP